MSLVPSVYGGDAAEPERVGALVDGWRVEGLLGRGGMGAVHGCRREADGAPGVIKFLAPELARSPALVARFLRECEGLRRLPPHPHLVRLLAHGAGASGPYMVMERVTGETLHAHLRARGRLAPAEAARLAGQVASALAVVHAHGLVHRDVTPANVMRTPAGQAKLIDFGLVRDLHRSTLTQADQLLGTIFYMAPEQLEGGRADARADVFALGALLQELLTGRPAFAGADVAEVAARILEGDAPAPRALVPDVPLELERVVLQALEVEPRHRYGSMAAVARDLARVLAGEPCSAPCLVGHGHPLRAPLLGARTFTLGADPACAVPLPFEGVAPHHAQVRRERRGFVLYDLRSPTGTFVRGERVTTTPRPLQDGDGVTLGGAARLVFHDPRPAD